MSKKIYVGNLDYKADEESLRGIFAEIGEVESVKIIKDPATGRSKGFGFVEMASNEAAKKAILSLNGKNFMDRTLTVNEARPQTERPRTGGASKRGFDRSGGGRKPGSWR